VVGWSGRLALVVNVAVLQNHHVLEQYSKQILIRRQARKLFFCK
jgi:hypothetical protein